MAKYEITHSCGHNYTHQIYGTNVNGERKYQAEKLSERICPSCYKRQKENERLNSSIKSRVYNKEAGLKPLSGSEKQVIWAETIRAEKAAKLIELKSFLDKDHELYNDVINIVDGILFNTSSKFWIERKGRDYTPAWLISEIQNKVESK